MNQISFHPCYFFKSFCIIYEQVGLSGISLCASHIAETLGKSWSQFFGGWQVFHFEYRKNQQLLQAMSTLHRMAYHCRHEKFSDTLWTEMTWKWNVGPSNWLPLRVESLFTLFGGEWQEHSSDTVTIHFHARSSIVPAQTSCQSKRLMCEQKALLGLATKIPKNGLKIFPEFLQKCSKNLRFHL